jgi:hypothetical protein
MPRLESMFLCNEKTELNKSYVRRHVAHKLHEFHSSLKCRSYCVIEKLLGSVSLNTFPYKHTRETVGCPLLGNGSVNKRSYRRWHIVSVDVCPYIGETCCLCVQGRRLSDDGIFFVFHSKTRRFVACAQFLRTDLFQRVSRRSLTSKYLVSRYMFQRALCKLFSD